MTTSTDHTYVPADANSYTSPDTGAVLKTIANPHPHFQSWQEHVLTLPELCPASHNPGAGSTLAIRYQATQRFLEVFSLSAYIQAFIGHKTVRDVEMLTQVIARDCAAVLHIAVEVEGCFELPALGQRVTTRVQA
ncbi:hypothetical protein ACLO87_13000 [Paenalcaligenes sp. Me52]|uniref:hypothetical protein n=1 Tax=Paenalcaligenes sp. Me52 TaxID=3392038 RepID=UPI00268F1850